MNTQKKILVLVDGTERSLRTIEYVGSLAPFKLSKIVLFHVFNSVPECYWDLEKEPKNVKAVGQLKAWESQNRKNITAYMEKAVKMLTDKGFSNDFIEIKIHDRIKGVARDILNEARDGYYAVVLRRRGLAALEGIYVGSVANKLFSKLSFVPVIVAGQSPPVKKILIAVDGSPSSEKAVDFVADLLGGSGYEACLFHVIRGFGSMMPDNPEFMMPAENIEMAKSEMTEMFQGLRNKLETSGFEPEKISEKIIAGAFSRAGTITTESETNGYGAIIMGRRGLSKVEEFLMGRVSNKVIYDRKRLTVWLI